MTEPDFITVIRSPWRRLAKLIQSDGTIKEYDKARTFEMREHCVGNLEDTREILLGLLDQPDCAVIRGAIIDRTRAYRVRRLIHPDLQTGDLPTIREQAHRWLMLDVDGVDRPASVPVTDLIGCAREAVKCLPAPFQQARCIIQATGSHGFKPGCRLRLAYWLSRPLGCNELRCWLKDPHIDQSIFSAAQIIYTAAPIFVRGLSDPIPQRIAEYPGAYQVDVPAPQKLQPPPQQPPKAKIPLRRGSAKTDLYIRKALSSAFDRISGAPRRHPVILAEACGLARFVRAGLISSRDLHSLLWQAAQHAGKTDQSEIDRIVDFALQSASAIHLPPWIAHE